MSVKEVTALTDLPTSILGAGPPPTADANIYEDINFSDLIFTSSQNPTSPQLNGGMEITSNPALLRQGGYFTYPCPCGDEFLLSIADLIATVVATLVGVGKKREEAVTVIAPCQSCSLQIRVSAHEHFLYFRVFIRNITIIHSPLLELMRNMGYVYGNGYQEWRSISGVRRT